MVAVMTGSLPSRPEARLTLKSQLDDLAQLWPWMEGLFGRYSVPAQTQYAIQLCLEEALSNVIRHGYSNQEDQFLTVDCAAAGGENERPAELVFTVEDHAPPFDPFAAVAKPFATSMEELTPGGQGIRFMQKFASRVAWEPLAEGNRLTLAFALAR
jgi:serine/threonine-protein kinase RsbW